METYLHNNNNNKGLRIVPRERQDQAKKPRARRQLPPKTLGRASDELLSYPAHNDEGESAIDPGVGLPIRNL